MIDPVVSVLPERLLPSSEKKIAGEDELLV